MKLYTVTVVARGVLKLVMRTPVQMGLRLHPRLTLSLHALLLLLGIAVASPYASAQVTSAAITPEQVPPIIGPQTVLPLPEKQSPPAAPQVSWNGSLLTIITNYSTLSDILEAVRAHTGAEIDMPETAARQRMAAKLGPGSVREVLSSLLSWTGFNYVIQASDKNPESIQSILVMARPKDAMENAALPTRRGGYIDPNLVDTENVQPIPVSAEAVTFEPQLTKQPTAPTLTPASTPDPSTTIADLQSSGAASTTLDTTLAAGQSKLPAQMIDQLQGMYQKRLQMQENGKTRTEQAP